MNTQQINGIKTNGHAHPLAGVKRSAASIRKQVASAKRNRRQALKEGRSYGKTPGKRNKLNSRRAALAGARGASKGASIGDAVTYLRHASDRAARLGPTGYATLGLISLALEALGAE